MKDAYITAVLAHLRNDTLSPTEVFARLQKVLAARGHSRLFGGIVRGVYRQLARLEKTIAPTLTVARQDDAQSAAVAATLKELATNDTPRVVVDDTIVGGHIVRYQNREINRSYKKALITLYQRITT